MLQGVDLRENPDNRDLARKVELLTQKVDENTRILHSMARKLGVDPSPSPTPRTNSPSAHSASSSGVRIEQLSVSDARSRVSPASTTSDPPHAAGECLS